MAITLSNADGALKTYYLDAISEQLNYANPFLAAIEKNTNDVYGKEIRKLASYGINGGIGAGTEDGALPTATGNNYKVMTSTLKNLYGVIEISDKAIRASENNAGAFVNLLNAEMEGLVKSSKLNFSRMLFGDGTGIIATADTGSGNMIFVNGVKNLFEGMLVDIRNADGELIENGGRVKILTVDYQEGFITVDKEFGDEVITAGDTFELHGSANYELTGLGKIFDMESDSIYGLNIYENTWLRPYIGTSTGNITESKIQAALDHIEMVSGGQVNFILCSFGVRRALQTLLATNSVRLDSMELAGGYKAITYNGIPIVADRFCPEGTMYLLNTNDFSLNQLCDWQWLSDDDGKVLKQVAGKPVYTATLVKYADLMCARPCGQGVLKDINEA